MGFSSVMIDGSALPYDENAALTKKVVEYAHQYDVTVEGELGVLAGVEDEVSAENLTIQNLKKLLTSLRRQVAILWLFLSVQVMVHTSSNQNNAHVTRRQVVWFLLHWHSMYSTLLWLNFLVSQSFFTVLLLFLRSMLISLTNMVVNLPDAVGIPEEQLRKAAKSAVCKINIDSDSRLAFTAAVRKVFAEKPGEFDPRKYCGPARDEMEKMYKHKITEVLGSDNKLAQL
jgi:fructose-bisphosphate aldolase class II